MLEYNGKASIRMSEYKVDCMNASHSLRVEFDCHSLSPLFDSHKQTLFIVCQDFVNCEE